ncbi:alpha/beta fold hydrolase [Ideonella sp. 4Y11]|uniref:Alpha/beta fold hydrolase n=1 Tax=Ideonella aquatica TaxID=2824119 RepID=A0A940YR65_9BURK|nr:alpha/beta fold hydrolase BchO [Ideonella aquatica]MBQ0960488.1 alpha/beta fold hydrolase [Ideonella aquatica]
MVSAGGLRWHLARWGDGPRRALWLHGTGACSDSFHTLAQAWLARDAGWTLLAPDLPGQGRSAPLPSGRRGMAAMATALRALLATQAPPPELVLGHSAGGALMLRLALDGGLPADTRLVGLNAALQPFDGLAGWTYPALARLLAWNPLVPPLAAWRARDLSAVRRLITATGSTLDEAAVARYGHWLRQPTHLAGVLSMMADWDLPGLQRDLPRLTHPLTLVVGERDAVVPPAQAARLRRPGVQVQRLDGLGHLMHEEDPPRLAALLLDQPSAACS